MRHLLGTDTMTRDEAVGLLDSAREFAKVSDQKDAEASHAARHHRGEFVL